MERRVTTCSTQRPGLPRRLSRGCCGERRIESARWAMQRLRLHSMQWVRVVRPSSTCCVHASTCLLESPAEIIAPCAGRSSVNAGCGFSAASTLPGNVSPIIKSRLPSFISPPSAKESRVLVSRLQQTAQRLRRPHDFFERPGWRWPCDTELPPSRQARGRVTIRPRRPTRLVLATPRPAW